MDKSTMRFSEFESLKKQNPISVLDPKKIKSDIGSNVQKRKSDIGEKQPDALPITTAKKIKIRHILL